MTLESHCSACTGQGEYCSDFVGLPRTGHRDMLTHALALLLVCRTNESRTYRRCLMHRRAFVVMTACADGYTMPNRRDAVVGTIRPNRLARIELVQATVHTSVRAFERSVAHRRCATCPGGAPPVQPAFMGVSTLENGPRPQGKHDASKQANGYGCVRSKPRPKRAMPATAAVAVAKAAKSMEPHCALAPGPTELTRMPRSAVPTTPRGIQTGRRTASRV